MNAPRGAGEAPGGGDVGRVHDCEAFAAQLADDGPVAPGLLAHSGTCPGCGELVRALESLRSDSRTEGLAIAADLPAGYFDGFEERVRARIAREAAAVPRRSPSPRVPAWALPLAAGVVFAALAFLLLERAGRSGEAPDVAVVTPPVSEPAVVPADQPAGEVALVPVDVAASEGFEAFPDFPDAMADLGLGVDGMSALLAYEYEPEETPPMVSIATTTASGSASESVLERASGFGEPTPGDVLGLLETDLAALDDDDQAELARRIEEALRS